MSNLFKRIFTSIILLSILLTTLFLNKESWLLLLIFTSIVSYFEFNNLIKTIWMNKKTKILSLKIYSIIFLILIVYAGYNLYSEPPVDLVFILLICMFSDVGGYVIGNLIGGKKLTKISPNKTISGSVGSFTFSMLPILIYEAIYKFTNDISYRLEDIYLYLIPLCFFLSLVCQCGDLFISYFKRRAKVNDTGTILPGHGGILDRIDGVIFVLPAAFIIKKLFLL
tara:strand:+ start:126 stop:800 length:675 start_codon:yes stop_codon:yes gene_type:complete